MRVIFTFFISLYLFIFSNYAAAALPQGGIKLLSSRAPQSTRISIKLRLAASTKSACSQLATQVATSLLQASQLLLSRV